MRKLTILLVDDDVTFVETHKILLKRHNYHVEVAYNGSECLKKLSEGLEPDLIILDVIMDTPSEGLEVARKLKAAETTKDIPIIMLTSVGEDFIFKYQKDETHLPVDLFLEKPVSPAQLLDEIRRTIKQ